MKKDQWIAVFVVLVLIATTAGYLFTLKGKQRLGSPGLKMVQRPVLYERGKLAVTNTIDLPDRVLHYEAQPLAVTDLEVSMLPRDTVFGRRRYTAKGVNSVDLSKQANWIDLSIVLMGADRTSIHKPQFCLEGQGWSIQRTELLSVPMQQPHPYDLPVMKLTAHQRLKDSQGKEIEVRAIYAYWFVSDKQLTAQHRDRVFWMARDLVTTGVLSRWAYITYMAICLPGQEDATFERMKEFIVASVPQFQLVSGPVRMTEAIVPGSGGELAVSANQR